MNKLMISVPGSGKTTAISDHISSMVENKSAQPEYIYAITFTREAANELKEKVGVASVNISTIHSLAYDILSRTNKMEMDAVSSIGDMFYDELLARATGSIGNMRIDFLAVDEAQDLSEPQYTFVKGLLNVSTNSLIVGDPYQSIFGFQGSDPKYMMMLSSEKPDFNTVPRSLSYRLPSEIARYVTSTFRPPVSVVPNRDGGSAETILAREILIPSLVVENIKDNTGMLFRTNAEIISTMRQLGDRSKEVNCIVPMSAHPFVTFASAIAQMGRGISGHELLGAGHLLGGVSWAATRVLKRIGNCRYTRQALEDIFGMRKDNPIVPKNDIPIMIPKVRQDIYNLIEVLDEYEEFYGDISVKSITGLIEKLEEDGYLVEEFWKNGGVDNSIVTDAIYSKITTRSESYHTICSGSSISLMTIHAAKGKEFDNVIVPVNIRKVDIYSQEEFRVMYVACTRPRETLRVFVPEMYTHDRSRANLIDLMSRPAGFI